MGHRVRLTPGLRERIVASIRAGGYPHVAAEAWGVPVAVLEEWLRRGRGPRARAPFAGFATEVSQAHAQARLKAEMGALENDARFWLQHGPGRDAPGRPGWSQAVKACDGGEQQGHVLLDAEVMRLLASVVEALEAFPEARAHLVERLQAESVRKE